MGGMSESEKNVNMGVEGKTGVGEKRGVGGKKGAG